MTIQKTIESLAVVFAKDVMTALRTASPSEMTDSTRSPTIRIKRRDGSVVHVARDVLALTGLLANRPGLRAEQIRAKLRWDKDTVTKAIIEALGERRVIRKGRRRGTTYYVA